MIQRVENDSAAQLAEYASYTHLAPAVSALQSVAGALSHRLSDRTIWMINSTAQGGGVAEMLPQMITLLRELGLKVEWAVIEAEEARFFQLTKQLHNLIHGSGNPNFEAGDRELYEAVNRRNADRLRPHLSDGDVLVVHDPQPMALAGMLAEDTKLRTVWRCHIGLDRRCKETDAAWSFLQPYATDYERAIFSAPEYVPSIFADRSVIIHPALDPLGAKNRGMEASDVAGVLRDSGLLSTTQHPWVSEPFPAPVLRLADGGEWSAEKAAELGILFRPIVTQISRWDRLKGFAPLLDGFVHLKTRLCQNNGFSPEERRRIEASRLVLAGPETAAIQDDPEALEVLGEISNRWEELPPKLQDDIALLALPMDSLERNAALVNALQRCSTVVAQNSIQEGFGLTATEAMWKSRPVLASDACGLRQQIRDGVEGRINPDPENPEAIGRMLGELLSDTGQRDELGRNAARRVYEDFLVFSQLTRWLAVLDEMVDPVVVR